MQVRGAYKFQIASIKVQEKEPFWETKCRKITSGTLPLSVRG